MDDRSINANDLNQSVAVSGDGNTVSLVFGDTGIVLPLRRPQFPRPERRKRVVFDEPFPERAVLRPDSGKVGFVGRTDMLAELRAWLADEADISVHAITARAGTGKTRLAIEFCRETDSDLAAKGEWVAGFLSADDLPAIVQASATRRFDWQRNMLLVIDYAARRHGDLGSWMDRLTGKRLETKLRILLLERQAPEGFGWWHDLTSPGLQSEQGRAELFLAPRPRDLPDLAEVEERRRLMAAALAAAGRLRAAAPPAWTMPTQGENPQ